jgi:hypothetical protein
MGMGEWRPDKVGGPEYNLVNPPLRDTVTVLFNGTTEDRLAWVAFRCVCVCVCLAKQSMDRCDVDSMCVWPAASMHCMYCMRTLSLTR